MTKVNQSHIDAALALLARPSGAHYCDLIAAVGGIEQGGSCQRTEQALQTIRDRGYIVRGGKQRLWLDFDGRAA